MRFKSWTRAVTAGIEVVWWVSVAAVVAGCGLLILVATHAAGGGAL